MGISVTRQRRSQAVTHSTRGAARLVNDPGSSDPNSTSSSAGKTSKGKVWIICIANSVFTFTTWRMCWKYRVKQWPKYTELQFSHSVISDSLQPHESQHARPPCPSPTPGVYPNPCPSSRWCHPAISSSVVPFSTHTHTYRTYDTTKAKYICLQPARYFQNIQI